MENKGFKKENVKQSINNNTKPKTEKFKVNFKPKKDITMDVLDFYNTKLKKMHIIFTVIAIVLYCIFFFSTFSSIRSGNYSLGEGVVSQGFTSMVKDTVLLDLVVIVAGITPYCFLSVIGLAQSVMIVNTLGVRYALGQSFMITCLIGGLLQVIGIALCVAVGVYYCRLATKKNKYYHHSDFGMDDLKMQFYQIKKDEKKTKELEKAKFEKDKKIQECNVKIPYFNFLVLGVVAVVMQVVGIIITLI